MNVLFHIALRNLREHRAKTIIIGVLVALGVFLLIAGNSVLNAAAEGTRRVFIENFTGHVMVRAKSDTPVSIAGTTGMSIEDYAGPRIPHYQEVYAYLNALPQVESVNPQIPFIVRIDYSTPEQNRGAILPLLGVEPESYLRMFPNALSMTEGRFLEPGEQGVVLPKVTVDQVEEKLGITISVGDTVKLQGMSQAAGVRIREVPVAGIYQFAVEAPAMDGIGFMDVQTVRSIAGMVVGTQAAVAIDREDTSLLDAGMLGEDEYFFSFEELDAEPVDEFTLFELPADGDFDFSAYTQTDSGAWSYLLLKLHNEGQTDALIQQINQDMDAMGISVEAVDWAAASSGMAGLIQAFSIFFLIVVLIITIVSIIIIMNTLVISVIERTTEIGTMRALGAQKSLVRKMFILETMTISCFFGLIGMLLGVGCIWLLNIIGLPAPNAFFEILFGAKLLRPVLSWVGIFQALLMMIGIGLLSSLYPVSVALKIQPVQAIKVD